MQYCHINTHRLPLTRWGVFDWLTGITWLPWALNCLVEFVSAHLVWMCSYHCSLLQVAWPGVTGGKYTAPMRLPVASPAALQHRTCPQASTQRHQGSPLTPCPYSLFNKSDVMFGVRRSLFSHDKPCTRVKESISPETKETQNLSEHRQFSQRRNLRGAIQLSALLNIALNFSVKISKAISEAATDS